VCSFLRLLAQITSSVSVADLAAKRSLGFAPLFTVFWSIKHFMRSGSSFIISLFLIALLFCLCTNCRAADRETTLYSFTGRSDGNQPSSGLISDAAGNLYGTTFYGGSCSAYQLGCGVVFELSPVSGGGWTENVIHVFAAGDDGEWPTDGVIFDANGNLYGTTFAGGAYHGGVVYELSPGANGWTEQILYSFGAVSGDGTSPAGGLVFDASGNLYGTDILGGADSLHGTVFELLPTSNSGWNETTLYSFTGELDGGWPYSGIVIDPKGNLYGTASEFGSGSPACPNGCGTVFQLSPEAGGGWKFRRLYNFDGDRGNDPEGRLTLDTEGNLYGTTEQGGIKCSAPLGCGVIYELSPGPGSWSETILHDFTNEADAARPMAGVILSSAGNLYGTAPGLQGFAPSVVFELNPGADSRWKFHVLYTFEAGCFAGSSLYLDLSGDLFGTTTFGGIHNWGSVYELSGPAGP
jgi:uncharacterized repeat protein (TIGR03803 family)